MKKRVAAIALAAFVIFNLITATVHAVVVAESVILTLGVLAFNLLGVMTGKYDDVAEGIGCFIENGVEGWQKAFIGTEDTPSWLASGWDIIYTQCDQWFADGDITIDDAGYVTMTYSQYVELCELVGMECGEFTVQLGTDIEHLVIPYQLNTALDIQTAPHPSTWVAPAATMSYAPVFYSDTDCYLGSCFLSFQTYLNSSNQRYCYFSPYLTKLEANPSSYFIVSYSLNGYYAAMQNFEDFLTNTNTKAALADDCTSFNFQYTDPAWGNTYSPAFSMTNWFYCDGSEISDAVSPDFTGYNFGWIAVDGSYSRFVNNVTTYSAAVDSPELDDLSGTLSSVLTLNDDPTLVIDTDTDIAIPTDAVIVTDIPGVAAQTLTELQNSFPRTDLDIPSTIITKFPFCLPFDFYKLLTIFAAEPEPPVFRIPISNKIDLSDYADNQTFGEYVNETGEPLFEIDEELVIDLSGIPLIQPISYTCFIVGFIFMLIMITTKLINH